MGLFLRICTNEQISCREKKAEAEAESGPMTPELRATLDKLPSDNDAVANEISKKQNEIDAIHLANPRALAEFTDRKQKIDELQKKAKLEKEGLDKIRLKVESLMVSLCSTWIVMRTNKNKIAQGSMPPVALLFLRTSFCDYQTRADKGC